MVILHPMTALTNFLKGTTEFYYDDPTRVAECASNFGLRALKIESEYGLEGYEVYYKEKYLGWADATCPDVEGLVFMDPEAQASMAEAMQNAGISD